MSRMNLERAQKKLRKALSMSDDFDFLMMLSNVDRMQSEFKLNYLSNFKAPNDAIRAKIGDTLFAPQWTLEDMANYKLVTPLRLNQKENVRCRKYHTNSWGNFSFFYNLVHKYQNLNDAKSLKKHNNIGILGPIGQKQFPFQRGFFNKHNFYKNALLYSGEESQKYMLEKLGFSFDEFSKCSFALISLFFSSPYIKLPLNFEAVGLAEHTTQAFTKHISDIIPNIRTRATQKRRGRYYETYAPSILRSKPCVIQNGIMICPVLPLLFERVTSGLYYDIIDGPSKIRNEIGENFEVYSKKLIENTFKNLTTHKEIEFGPKGRKKKSADILIGHENEIALLVECKATRLSFDSKFSPREADPNKIIELVKGIVQVWKTAAFLRTGKLKQLNCGNELIGIVLTLDSWTLMNIGRYARVLERATELAKNETIITEADKIKVALCDIEDFEDLLATATLDSFRETVKLATTPKWINWSLSNIHKEVFPGIDENKDYSFLEEMSSVLPWWSEIEKLREDAK